MDFPTTHKVYRSPRGEPMLYVRTEKRSGRPEPEHLFVSARSRNVFQRWTEEIPEDFELIVDVVGRAEVNDLGWQLEAEKAKSAALVDCLKTACNWLPKDRADELRRRYASAA